MVLIHLMLVLTVSTFYNVVTKVKCNSEVDNVWRILDDGSMIYTCDDTIGWNVSFSKGFPLLNENIYLLIVENCTNVIASLQVNTSQSPYILESLVLRNIFNLTIISLELDMQLTTPLRIFIENCVIKDLPPQSFITHGPPYDTIVFDNVTIDGIETDAFYNLNISTYFLMNEVRVNTMNVNAMQLYGGEVTIQHSHINVMDLLSIQATSHSVNISNCYIKQLRLRALDIIADTFIFSNNFGFDIVMPRAFSITARDTALVGNKFAYLQTSALEHISPLGNNHSQASYRFQNNVVMMADAGSLHVDFLAYELLKARMNISNNMFLCSCTHLGWLGVISTTNEPDIPELRRFHKELLSEKFRNMCYDAPCDLPISILQSLVQTDLCAANLTGEDLCELFNEKSVQSSANEISDIYHFTTVITIINIFFSTMRYK